MGDQIYDRKVTMIRPVAKATRFAFENYRRQVRRSESPAKKFYDFPVNCCDDVAVCLLIIFRKLDLPGFQIVRSELVPRLGTKHCWIQNDQIVVDITADQFSTEGLSPVIVGESNWHKSLPIDQEFGAKDLNESDEFVFDSLVNDLYRHGLSDFQANRHRE
ncbi:hypothetical protein KOR42_48160 [Thalassoglobus neptunius]|uniref:Uncharacterized protein n=1 Tax=Thalassoglobus neptunius TaxID=1938619 RepID=A0A5C5VTL1_9PLAN|nr:hypothetical protein KOR42_48160 [Thalassoglobus neptunius]